MTDYRKSLPAELSEVKALPDGVLRFIVSHEAPDLVGDIVVQRGMKPVSERLPAQVDHSGRMEDVIGYWDNLKTHGDYTTADLNLVEKGVSKMADLVRALSDSGVKLAASIGFMADKAEPIKPKGYKFEKTLLHEISVVVVPCQPLALQLGKAFGIELGTGGADAKAGSDSEQLLKGKLSIKRAKAAVAGASRIIRRNNYVSQ